MLTVNQASERLSITPSLVRRYCRAGTLKAKKIGRDWLIEPRAIDEFTPRKVGRPCKQ